MSNILIAGFKGNKNSAKLLLDNLKTFSDKLYLDNDFEKSKEQLIEKLKTNKYNVVYAFGQKPLIKSIYIEIIGQKENNKYLTNYDYQKLSSYLGKYYKVKISENAGNYLCNNVYYEELKYIKDNNLNIKMIFIHIPCLKNINIIDLSNIINSYIEQKKETTN